MVIHYAEMENYGNYKSPCWGTELTLCGCTGEKPCENSINDWEKVTCKNCLKRKKIYTEYKKAEEEIIINQMGEMADFMQRSK